MNGTEALETIKSIELMHVEHEQDEDIDGEWVYTDHEVYDGTVGENYAQEIEVLEKELKALEIIKRLFNVTASYNRTCEEYTINILPKPNKLAKAMMNIVTKDEFDLLKEVMK